MTESENSYTLMLQYLQDFERPVAVESKSRRLRSASKQAAPPQSKQKQQPWPIPAARAHWDAESAEMKRALTH